MGKNKHQPAHKGDRSRSVNRKTDTESNPATFVTRTEYQRLESAVEQIRTEQQHRASHEKKMLATTIGAVVVGLLAAAGTIWQAVSAGREIGLNRALIVLDESKLFRTAPTGTTQPGGRPGVKATGEVRMTGRLDVGDQPIAEVVFRNRGRTAAINADGGELFTILKSFPADDLKTYPIVLSPFSPLPQGYNTPAQNFVAVDQTMGTTDMLNHSLTAMEIDSLYADRLFLVVYGFIKYNDGFGVIRESKFCRFFNTVSQGLTACPTHNNAT
jgi:hypothetical protein